MTLYDVPYILAAPVMAAPMAWKRWRHGKYRESLPAMLGRRLPRDRKTRLILPQARRPVWIHAVSVGEVNAAKAMARALRLRLPDFPIIVSTTTETGQAHARAVLGELADEIFFAPLDFSWNVRRFADYYDPAAYVVMETELWPNILLEMRRRGAPAFLVNGRLNDKSFAGYRRFRWAMRPALRTFRACLMQTPMDAERITALGAEPPCVSVMGNCKFDALPEPLAPEERHSRREAWGWSASDFVIVAGSTHPGEEEAVLEAMKSLMMHGNDGRNGNDGNYESCGDNQSGETGLSHNSHASHISHSTHPPIRLVLAPRHPERFNEAAEIVRRSGLRIARFSEGPATRGGNAPDVLLLDTMGQLASWFGVGDVAIVGGSITDKVGGHNLLEPAAHGVPVLHGPHMFKQPEIMKIVRQHRATLETRDLAAALHDVVGDPARRAQLAEAARTAAASTRGSADQAAQIIAQALERAGSANQPASV